MLARLKLWAAAVGLVIAALATSWFAGRKSGQTDTKVRQTERDLDTSLRAKEIENEVGALDIDALKSRSRVWVRGPDK